MTHPWESDELLPLPVSRRIWALDRIAIALFTYLFELGVRR
jgi:hypothetical protein